MPPKFGASSREPAHNTYALVGGSASIHCSPTGAPKPHIRWRKKTSGEELRGRPRFTVESSGTLLIHDVRQEDEGTYQCIASNEHGTATKEGMLTVSGEERFNL